MPLAVRNSWIPNVVAVSIAGQIDLGTRNFKHEMDVHIDESGLTGDNLYTFAWMFMELQ